MRILLLLVFALTITVTQAQKRTNKQLSARVILSTDVDLNFMLEKHTAKNKRTDEQEGYRIQIIYNTDRDEVYAKKAQVYREFNKFKTYIVYDQPYYKLRIGDFTTRLEARKYLEQVLAIFPTAFIVKDTIKI